MIELVFGACVLVYVCAQLWITYGFERRVQRLEGLINVDVHDGGISDNLIRLNNRLCDLEQWKLDNRP